MVNTEPKQSFPTSIEIESPVAGEKIESAIWSVQSVGDVSQNLAHYHPDDLNQVCQSQIHRGPNKQIGYNPRAGLVQCLLKHIEMIARSLLNQDLTLCIIY